MQPKIEITDAFVLTSVKKNALRFTSRAEARYMLAKMGDNIHGFKVIEGRHGVKAYYILCAEDIYVQEHKFIISSCIQNPDKV